MSVFSREAEQPGSGPGDAGTEPLPAMERLADAARKAAAVADATGSPTRGRFERARRQAAALAEVVDERSVDVHEEVDEDAFFSTVGGNTTLANRYDMEKAVPLEKKRHFEEVERYWVNKPYAYVVIFHSSKENETKYYLIEPHLTPIEEELKAFLAQKLRTAIKYESDDVLADGDDGDRAAVIERETRKLLDRYDLVDDSVAGPVDEEDDSGRFFGLSIPFFGGDDEEDEVEAADADPEPPDEPLSGLSVRPEPVIVEEDESTLTEYQVEKLLYELKRDFVGYERIDGIKHDINVEDISCDGYDSPVFVYHSEYENVITNVYHGRGELDDFVVKLAQRSGKGISKRQPQVDATLPDGSRSQLTLGKEVSDHGTNYTIRQFKDVPFTPIDLINWRTFSLEQMALLWLAIENHKSLIFAGGTASGKTTSLNAVSLFIPSNTKIVSIEDTREVELPQRNWIASVTRPSFSGDDRGDIDEFDLLEAALRQRPDYIVMGEIRGEEGRTLFQVMSTGHTTYTTFHADSVGEVLKRFTTEPINVSKTLFTALDLVSIQRQTRVQGRKVRRSMSITEINDYNAEHDEINVQDIYQWRAEGDVFEHVGRSNLLETIQFDRGWDREELDEELEKRKVVLSYLIRQGLNEYAQVAATLQAFISDPDTVLGLIAADELEARLSDLREMESVQIDIDPETEALVPRPDPTEQVYELTGDILEAAETGVLAPYGHAAPSSHDLKRALDDAFREPDDEGTAPAPGGRAEEPEPAFIIEDAAESADAEGSDDVAAEGRAAEGDVGADGADEPAPAEDPIFGAGAPDGPPLGAQDSDDPVDPAVANGGTDSAAPDPFDAGTDAGARLGGDGPVDGAPDDDGVDGEPVEGDGGTLGGDEEDAAGEAGAE